MREIFVDLDGVLADCHGGYLRQFNEHIHEVPDAVWQANIASDPDFYFNLELLPGADEFFSGLRQFAPIILSSVAAHGFIPNARAKRAWVKKHLGVGVPFYPCRGGTNKPAYMHQAADILVDDYKKNIDAWNNHGGYGVLFEGDYNETRSIIFRTIVHGVV